MFCDCVLFQSAVTSSIYEGVGLPLQEKDSNSRPNRQFPSQTRTHSAGGSDVRTLSRTVRTAGSDGLTSRSDGPSYGKNPSVIGVLKSDGPTSKSDGPTLARTVRLPSRTVRPGFSALHCFGLNFFIRTRIWTFQISKSTGSTSQSRPM